MVCLAREELLEERPAFLEGRANVDRILLDALSGDETDALLEGLGGARSSRISAPASSRPRRATLSSSSSSSRSRWKVASPSARCRRRFRRCSPPALTGSVPASGPCSSAGRLSGRSSRPEDVLALLDPDAAPTADTHLQTLAGRGFVRQLGDGVLRFRHVLVQEAVYRAAPKRLRAELHERFADRLDRESPELPDLDEFVGYHLEQAYRLRTELGESDRRTEQLAEDAGRRLGDAGFRAFKRGDMPAAVSLLGRAVTLLPAGDELRHELMCELGIAQHSATGTDAGLERFPKRSRVRRRPDTVGSSFAPVSSGRTCDFSRRPEGAARELLELAERAVPTLEALDDSRSLARAWLLIGYVKGGIHGNHAAWEEAEERALEYYRATSFPSYSCLQQIAAAMYWGPTPVAYGIERGGELLADETIGHFGRAAIAPFIGGLRAQAGEFSRRGRSLPRLSRRSWNSARPRRSSSYAEPSERTSSYWLAIFMQLR